MVTLREFAAATNAMLASETKVPFELSDADLDYTLTEGARCYQCDKLTNFLVRSRCAECALGLPPVAVYSGVRPRCYNRPAFAQGRWLQVSALIGSKPRFRWYPRWFVDRCATKDGTGIGPNNENYPAAHGWNCEGCKWN